MPRKIKKKPVPQPHNEGKIILIVAGILLAAIAVFLIILAIVQNAGRGQEESSRPTETSFTASQLSETAAEDSSAVSPAEDNKPSTDYMSAVAIDTSKDYYADITIKDYGKIIVKLDYEAAPTTVRNFVYLTESGFYNGLTFHRIMEGFMMQGGDPQGNGFGGAEHNIYGEFTANGFNNPLSHTRGAISMARSDDMNSASSQFFIVQTDNYTASLDGKYAAFGYVTEGIEIVDAVCRNAQPTDNNGTIPAAQQPVIESLTIRTTDKSSSAA